MDDRKLRQNVIDELEFDPRVDATGIGVAAERGVVTLTGHVSSYAAKIAAEDATRRVKGVCGIAQEIEIRFLDEKKDADDEIAKRALDIINWTIMTPRGDIKVMVQKGWIYLTGEVNWHFQRKAAESAVRRLSGVKGVTNSIMLRMPEPTVQGAEIKKKIEAALARHAHIEAQNIRIGVLPGNEVLIEGKVDSLVGRAMVKDAAWSVPGVRVVDDRLKLAP